MDVLKDITDGLREESGNRRTEYEQGPDHERRSASERDDRFGRSASGSAASGNERDDDHLCAFCQHEFDADRGACPDCGAEIVLRGRR